MQRKALAASIPHSALEHDRRPLWMNLPHGSVLVNLRLALPTDVCFEGCDVLVFLRNKGRSRSPGGRPARAPVQPRGASAPPRAPPRPGADLCFIKNEVIFSRKQRSLSLDRTKVRLKTQLRTCPSITWRFATRTGRRKATITPSCVWTSTLHLSINNLAFCSADWT
jgi:hypothetical protein